MAPLIVLCILIAAPKFQHPSWHTYRSQQAVLSTIQYYYWEHGSMPRDGRALAPLLERIDPEIRPPKTADMTIESTPVRPTDGSKWPYDRVVTVVVRESSGRKVSWEQQIPCFPKGSFCYFIALDVHRDGHLDWVDEPLNFACLVSVRVLDLAQHGNKQMLAAELSRATLSVDSFRALKSLVTTDGSYFEQPITSKYSSGATFCFKKSGGRLWIVVSLKNVSGEYWFDMSHPDDAGNLRFVPSK